MKTVIMIDDDPSILDAFKIIFEGAGYSITVYSNPLLVLENRFIEPDIFIIDKQLNGADGADVCKFLKQRPTGSKTPVIIFSAATRLGDYAREAGADDYLEKPFEIKELLAMVNRLTTNLPDSWK